MGETVEVVQGDRAARELLAAELEACGLTVSAFALRLGQGHYGDTITAALRAISKALAHSAPVPAERGEYARGVRDAANVADAEYERASSIVLATEGNDDFASHGSWVAGNIRNNILALIGETK